MRDLVEPLGKALENKTPFCWCRVVETRGSTPQKAGAAMMVFADGNQAGTLGGGCVEAEVKRRAIEVLDGGTAEIKQFVLDHDYGWDDGLICGGRMTASLHPANIAGTREYLQQLSMLLVAGEGFTEAIAFESETVPAACTSLFDAESKSLAATPNGNSTDRIVSQIKPLACRPLAYASDGIAFLPHLPRCRLIIIGGGHVGKAVADLAVDLDFDVWVADDRAEYVSEQRFGRVHRRIAGRLEDELAKLDITPNTYCLIVTRGHNHDERALYHVANRGAAYVGMIGSKRKIRMIFDDLLEQGISQEVLDRVHTPVGLDIGSRTVPEIAISIAAELIQHRNVPAATAENQSSSSA